jgi:hypothetical protein
MPRAGVPLRGKGPEKKTGRGESNQNQDRNEQLSTFLV